MAKEMLINVSEGEECRIALVEDGRLEELYMERTSSTSHVGNIYKGRVTNVEASIQAAFIDFGLGRNGFLHVSDLLPEYFGKKGDDVEEYVGKKMARRDRPPIQRCLRRGDEIIVQVIKEGIGTKGPTLSSYLSVSGKMLVMMPGVSGRGVSRKIEDEQERRRLKQILDSLDPPKDCGFIIRTESVGKSKAEIERDLKYLARLWDQMKRKRDSSHGPTELYTEGDLVTRTIRDVFNTDVDRLIVDSAEVAERVRDVIKLTSPRAKDRVETYDSPIPLFHKYGIERDIELMYSRHVPLPGGGSLVIDSTEAIVAIDVNSGKNRANSDAEMTAFKVDMEAADEICRQLKLRDLGGVIICDFIDLRYERHRRDLERRLDELFKKDRAKTKVLAMSQFGIVEITRQRMRPSLKRSVYFDCPHCKGAGLVKTPESMSLDVMRRLAIAMNDLKVVRAELGVCADVAYYLNNKKRRALADLEDRTKKNVAIKIETNLGLDEMRLDLFDNRDGMVLIPNLNEVLTAHPHTSQLHTRPVGRAGPPAAGQPGGRFDGRRRTNERRPPTEGRGDDRARDMVEDRFELDDDQEAHEPMHDEPMHDEHEHDRAVDEGGEPAMEAPAAFEDDRDQPQRRDNRNETRRNEPRRDETRRDDRPDGSRDNRNEQRPNERDNRDHRGGDQRQDSRNEPRRDGRAPQPRNDRNAPPPRDDRDNRQPARDARSDGRNDGRAEPRRDEGRNQRPNNQQERGQARRDGPPLPQGGRAGSQGNSEPARQDGRQQRPPQGAPIVPPAGSDAGLPGDEGEAGGRRRRRRRRGRGRGRQGQNQPLEAMGDYPEGPGEHPQETDRHSADAEHDDFDDRDVRNDEAAISDERGDEKTAAPREAEYVSTSDHGDYEDESDEHTENIVEEPIIVADSAGKIVSETVTTSRYESGEPVVAPAAEPEAAEAPAKSAKPKRGGRAKATTKAAAPAAKAKKAPAAKTPRGRSRRKPAGTDALAEEPAAEAETSSPAQGKSGSKAPAASVAKIAEEVPTAGRKGRADKHLVTEAEPEAETHLVDPPRRPRSYSDLDSIPDDFD